jgi:hypothetical protein
MWGRGGGWWGQLGVGRGGSGCPLRPAAPRPAASHAPLQEATTSSTSFWVRPPLIACRGAGAGAGVGVGGRAPRRSAQRRRPRPCGTPLRAPARYRHAPRVVPQPHLPHGGPARAGEPAREGRARGPQIPARCALRRRSDGQSEAGGVDPGRAGAGSRRASVVACAGARESRRGLGRRAGRLRQAGRRRPLAPPHPQPPLPCAGTPAPRGVNLHACCVRGTGGTRARRQVRCHG